MAFSTDPTAAQNNIEQARQDSKEAATQTIDKAADMASQAADKASEMASGISNKASQMASDMKDKASEMAATAESKTDSALASLGDKMNGLASTLRDKAPADGRLHDTVGKMADKLSTSAEYLSNHGVSDITSDVTSIIQKHPIQSMWIGVGVGVLLGIALSSRR